MEKNRRLPLLAFPIGWAIIPALWVSSVLTYGLSFAGFWYELGVVAAATATFGTGIGAGLWLVGNALNQVFRR